MARNLFSVPIFFIVFRETLEASIIVAVLLGLAEQIVRDDDGTLIGGTTQAGSTTVAPENEGTDEEKKDASTPGVEALPRHSGQGSSNDDIVNTEVKLDHAKLIRKLRIQIFVGALLGFLLALAIGAAFIAVWFTQASDLWSKSEEIWEGTFSLIASLMIFVMGITMLKMNRAKAKWRVKLQRAFDQRTSVERGTRAGKWAFFILPFITVLREGMEAVIFVGGVSLGQAATSIPIAAIAGILCGLICGYLIYAFASKTALKVFLITMTNFLLLIGAGLFSKAVWDFEENAFNHLLGADVDDAGGDGPGSFNVRGSVWHLDCCNPENNVDGQGWLIFGAIFGWTNSATVGSVLSYIFYWLAAIVVLVYMKWSEGRVKLLGKERSKVSPLPQQS